tara:strand:- start:8674 stop:11265 length:2592 start_codon:yes stop_codon:yes gene_type:complete
MYDWLSEALDASGTVVTANRRLARILTAVYAEQQQASGSRAWRSPNIRAWNDWLLDCTAAAQSQKSLPTRINAHQSQWLWEQCWRQEIGERDVSMAHLVRLSRDAWQRMSDWQIGTADIVRAAQNDDQRSFAAVASRYQAALRRDDWLDDAGTTALLLELIRAGQIAFDGAHTFAGFDRQRPAFAAIQAAMRDTGVLVNLAPARASNSKVSICRSETEAAELRTAGSWARDYLAEKPGATIAIVADGLDSDADRIARLVREGFTPGWPLGHRALFDALNVSYGRRLADFPVVMIAQTVLRWLHRDLSSIDVCLLLRSPLVGKAETSGRSRLDLVLRELPDRDWSPSMVTSELRGRDDSPAANDWLDRLAALSKRKREVPPAAAPSEWAVFFDETLRQTGWPGDQSLDSDEFQIVNRWRELLNEFARLALVSPRMTLGVAVARLGQMAAETVFQPESSNALLQLLGPLEAAGAEFDALWITGLSSENWPPAGTPSPLISKRLQEAREMPDSTPDDTLQYARNVLQRLVGAAPDVVCSFALNVDDAEQSLTDLLDTFAVDKKAPNADPGWYAGLLLPLGETVVVDDPVPRVGVGERLRGGASVIQRQISEPLSAFVVHRLGARAIFPQAFGIPAPLRGNLLHDALSHLYGELPSSDVVRNWLDSDLESRVDAAINSAFVRYEKNADTVLRHLFSLERLRLKRLLHQFVVLDAERPDFKVASVEGEFEFISGNIQLDLRFDRFDQFEDGTFAILDYKSGAKKKLFSKKGDIEEVQLFVYTLATDATVSALALVNIDSREITFAGAGRGFTDEAEWPDLLQQAQEQIAIACKDLAAGDVRIATSQHVQDARRLNPLSRFSEIGRDNG